MAYRLDVSSGHVLFGPHKCPENILISCQSHEISHKNVGRWLFLESRSGSSGPHSYLAAAGSWLPSVDEAPFPRVTTAPYVSHLVPSSHLGHLPVPTLSMVRRTLQVLELESGQSSVRLTSSFLAWRVRCSGWRGFSGGCW